MDNYALYRALFENSRDGVIIYKDKKIVDVNESTLRIFEENQKSEIHDKLGKNNIHIEEENRLIRHIQIETKSGEKDIEILSISSDETANNGIFIIRDITERTQLERRYRTIFEKSADLILVTKDTGVVFINPSGLKYLGFENENEIIGKSTLNFIHDDYKEIANTYSAMRRAGQSPPQQYRVKMVNRNGESLDVEFNASFIEWDGTPASLTMVRDISKQVKAENELKDSQQRLFGFIEAATDGYSILDSQMRYIMVNDMELKYTGRKREEYIGKHILEVFPNLKNSERYQGYLKVWETGDPIEYQIAMELPEKNMMVDFSAFKAGDVLGIVAKDVTEQVKYKNRLEALYSHALQLDKFTKIEEIGYGTVEIIRELLGFKIGSFAFVQNGKLEFTEFMTPSKITELPLDGKGITVRAVKTGRTQLVPDTSKDPDYVKGRRYGEETRSELDVPIIKDGSVIALINLESNNLDAFSVEDQKIVETLAAYIVSTINRIEYDQRLTAIHNFSLKINDYNSIEEIAQEALKLSSKSFNFISTRFWIVDDETLSISHCGKKNEKIALNNAGIIGKTIDTGEKLVTNQANSPITTYTIPILEHNKVKGVIEVKSNTNTQFAENTFQLLELLADHISARLTTLRLESERIRVEQAEEMKRIKTRFVSTATHELRTPLTSMKGYLELALNESDIDTIRKYLEVAMRNTSRLETLTSDLLDQQKIEEGRIDMLREKIDVKNLINSVLEEVSGMLKKRTQVVFSSLPSADISLIGDELRLGQVLINLLNNASNYSPDGSKIYLEASTLEDNLVVSIRDEGCGIEKEDITKLFKPFPDIEKPVVSQRSVGLGLSICKGFIEIHGGKIWAESEGREKGSKFTFTIPLSQQ